jgi:hypothetical protein
MQSQYHISLHIQWYIAPSFAGSENSVSAIKIEVFTTTSASVRSILVHNFSNRAEDFLGAWFRPFRVRAT